MAARPCYHNEMIDNQPKTLLATTSVGLAYCTLKNKTVLNALTVCKWLAQNLNELHTCVTGNDSRKIDKLVGHGVRFTLIENRPVFVVNASWEYAEGTGYPLDLKRLSSTLQGIDFRTHTCTSTEHELRAEFVIDLAAWPNMVQTRICENLFALWVAGVSNHRTHDKLLNDVQILLDRFYPDITLDFLRIPADLGLLEEDGMAFTSWFNSHCQNQVTPDVRVPNDL